MRIDGITSRGLVRALNQDRFSIVRHPEFRNLYGCIVCDGVGGSNAGEVASSETVQEFVKSFIKIDHYSSLADLRGWISRVVSEINGRIYELANNNVQYHGMSTTVVIALICEFGTLYVNIGDSRVYIIDHRDKLIRLSNDHSVVFDMVMRGSITMNQAKTHPLRNAVTNALGIYPEVRMDLHEIKVPYHQLMLCSDGLHGYVEESVIESILINKELSVRSRLSALQREAEKAGGHDNFTAVIADVNEQGEQHVK